MGKNPNPKSKIQTPNSVPLQTSTRACPPPQLGEEPKIHTPTRKTQCNHGTPPLFLPLFCTPLPLSLFGFACSCFDSWGPSYTRSRHRLLFSFGRASLRAGPLCLMDALSRVAPSGADAPLSIYFSSRTLVLPLSLDLPYSCIIPGS